MFIPLYDDNPWRSIGWPYMTRGLIAVTALVFVVLQSGGAFDSRTAWLSAFAVIPAEFTLGGGMGGAPTLVPEPVTLVTYAFLHGSWMHLLGNMLFLWVFGDNVEDAMGHAKFLAFYLLCAAAAGLAHALVFPSSQAVLIGASGAVAGVLAAYLVLHPRVKVWVLVFGRFPLKISAMWMIGAWLVFQVFNIFIALDESTAWWAHIGGFAAGAALIPLLRRREVPLLDRGLGQGGAHVDRVAGGQ
jgi:membrane associated rhomboid family serine protease